MAYSNMATTGMGPDDRRSEADRIVKILRANADFRKMTLKEQVFIEKLRTANEPVSDKQLLWARDIKDRHV